MSAVGEPLDEDALDDILGQLLKQEEAFLESHEEGEKAEAREKGIFRDESLIGLRGTSLVGQSSVGKPLSTRSSSLPDASSSSSSANSSGTEEAQSPGTPENDSGSSSSDWDNMGKLPGPSVDAVTIPEPSVTAVAIPPPKLASKHHPVSAEKDFRLADRLAEVAQRIQLHKDEIEALRAKMREAALVDDFALCTKLKRQLTDTLALLDRLESAAEKLQRGVRLESDSGAAGKPAHAVVNLHQSPSPGDIEERMQEYLRRRKALEKRKSELAAADEFEEAALVKREIEQLVETYRDVGEYLSKQQKKKEHKAHSKKKRATKPEPVVPAPAPAPVETYRNVGEYLAGQQKQQKNQKVIISKKEKRVPVPEPVVTSKRVTHKSKEEASEHRTGEKAQRANTKHKHAHVKKSDRLSDSDTAKPAAKVAVNDERLYHGALEGDVGKVKDLIQLEHVDVDAVHFESGNSALFGAAEFGDLHLVKFLLAQKADIHFKNRRGEVPLHLSIKHRRDAVTAYLLENGADLLATDNVGNTPWDMAGQSSSLYAEELRKYYKAAILAQAKRDSKNAEKKRKEIVAIFVKGGRDYQFRVSQKISAKDILQKFAAQKHIEHMVDQIVLEEKVMGKEQILAPDVKILASRDKWPNKNPNYCKFVIKIKAGAPQDVQMRFREVVYSK